MNEDFEKATKTIYGGTRGYAIFPYTQDDVLRKVIVISKNNYKIIEGDHFIILEEIYNG